MPSVVRAEGRPRTSPCHHCSSRPSSELGLTAQLAPRLQDGDGTQSVAGRYVLGRQELLET